VSYVPHDAVQVAESRSDGNIRYYEFEGDSLHSLNEYKSAEPRESMSLSYGRLSFHVVVTSDDDFVADRWQNAE
jgi:hypothetical protein